MRVRHSATIAPLLAVLLATCLTAQEHPAVRQGLEMETAYQSGSIDHVNLSNGNLSIVLPISQVYAVGGGLSHGFSLTYNSNVWLYDSDGLEPIAGALNLTPAQAALMSGSETHNAGLGWRVSLAQLWAPQDQFNESDRYLLVEPDGTQRLFYESLHEGEQLTCAQEGKIGTAPVDCLVPYLYTRDGSYLRAKITRSSTDDIVGAEIESPDGTKRTFDTGGRPAKVEDTFGNLITYQLPFSAQDDQSWSVTENARTQKLFFEEGPNGVWRLDYAEFSAFQDPTVSGTELRVVDLQYRDELVSGLVTVTHEDRTEDPPVDVVVEVSLLERISIGSGAAGTGLVTTEHAAYEMEYYGATDVETDLRGQEIPGLQQDIPGVQGALAGGLESLKLPTGGQYKWTYGDWDITNCFTQEFERVSFGVKSKEVFERNGILSGTWVYNGSFVEQRKDYGFTLDYTLNELTANDSRMVLVTDPNGNQSINYFASELSGVLQECTQSEWFNGLPFTFHESEGANTSEIYLSSAYYNGAVNPENLQQGLLRKNYVRYTGDAAADQIVGNKRVVRSRTRGFYENDADPPVSIEVGWKQTVNSRFDGLGHYRQSTQSSSGYSSTSRTSTTEFNAGGGDYTIDIETQTAASGNFTLPATTNPWLTMLFDSSTVSQDGDVFKSEYCFDQATGFLERTRQLARTDGSRSRVDTVQEFTRSTTQDLGLPRVVKQYGGDTTLLPTGHNANLCTVGLGSAAYTQDLDYERGVPKTARFRPTSGANVGPWSLYRTQIDAATGMVRGWLDPSASVTSETRYDVLGRTRYVSPAGEDSKINITYGHASGSSSVSFSYATRDLGGGDIQEARTTLDGFGRPELAERSVPLGNGIDLSKQKSCYNAMGWLASQSAWSAGPGACPTGSSPGWTHIDRDRWGRPTVVYPPDGNTHRVQYFYRGDRRTVIRTRVATDGTSCSGASEGDESCVDQVNFYDAYGRLAQVNTPSDGANAVYSYDALGQPTRVRTRYYDNVNDVWLNQDRTFEYDGRGFLTCEIHPEKGVDGYGATRYYYDALGNVTRRFEAKVESGVDPCSQTEASGFDLGITYDDWSRVTEVRDLILNELVKEFTYYAGTNSAGARLGRLESATRHNRLALSSGPYHVPISETYVYAGRSGRLSERLTNTHTGGVYRQTWVYDSQGDLSEEQLPCVWDASSQSCWNPPVTIGRHYAMRHLEAVDDWINQVTYHDNGMLAEIDWAGSNVASYIQDKDPNGIQRMGSYGTESFNTGLLYDGSGNVKGTQRLIPGDDPLPLERYRYDAQQRLSSFKFSPGDNREQNYAYDPWGNLNNITTTDVPGGTGSVISPDIDWQTNRITQGWSYDEGGNVVSSNGFSFDWDPAGMLRSFETADTHHLYNAADERIAVWTPHPTVPTYLVKWTLRDLANRVVTEFENNLFSDPTFHYTLQGFGGIAGRETQIGTVIEGVDPDGNFYSQFLPQQERRYYPLNNHLGTPRQLIEDAPAGSRTVDNILLWGYGEDADSSIQTSSNSPFWFTGHERDFNTSDGIPEDDDFDMMHARMYWPLYGRFLSPDPILGSGQLVQSWNRYMYVLGNPTTMVDPTGLQTNLANTPDCAEDPKHPLCIELGGPDRVSPGSGVFDDPWASIDLFTQANPAFGHFRPTHELPLPLIVDRLFFQDFLCSNAPEDELNRESPGMFLLRSVLNAFTPTVKGGLKGGLLGSASAGVSLNAKSMSFTFGRGVGGSVTVVPGSPLPAVPVSGYFTGGLSIGHAGPGAAKASVNFTPNAGPAIALQGLLGPDGAAAYVGAGTGFGNGVQVGGRGKVTLTFGLVCSR